MYFRCIDCTEIFTTIDKLTVHAKGRGHKPFRCGEATCRISSHSGGRYLSFKSQADLSEHVRNVHGTHYKSGGAFRCPNCDAGFWGEYPLLDHFRAMHKKLFIHICHICPRVFLSIESFHDHLDVLHRTMQSAASGDQDAALDLPFLAGLGLESGSNSDHPVPALLTTGLISRRDLVQVSSAQEGPGDRSPTEPTRQPSLAAGSQVLSSGSNEGLPLHETDASSASHLGVSASTSTPANISFSTSRAYAESFATLNTTSLRCMDCGEAFAKLQNLLKHGINRAHTPFRCGHCQVSDGARLLSFASHGELLGHVRGFHYHAVNAWRCPSCLDINRHFLTEVDLVQHFQAKHSDKVLRLCHLCADGFLTVDALRAHIASAHPRAPHVVRQRDVRDITIDNDEDDLQEAMDLHVALHRRCPICDNYYRILSIHYTLAHPDLKCKHCGKLFTSSIEIAAHYRHEHVFQKEKCLCEMAVRTEKPCGLHGYDEDIWSDMASGTNADPRQSTPSIPCHANPDVAGPVAETESSLAEASLNVCSSANSSSDDLVASAPAALELEHEELRAQASAGATETADGAQCEEHQGGPSSVADTAQAEDTPTSEHASAVSSDWERISSLAVSDCSDLSSEVVSVRSNSPASSTVVRSESPQPPVAAAIEEEDNASRVVAAAVSDVGSEDKDSSGADRVISSKELQNVITSPAPPTADQVSQPPTASEGLAESQVQPATTQPVLACKSCAKGPTEPVVTMCRHVFCHGCILNALATTLSCPACNHPIFVRLNL